MNLEFSAIHYRAIRDRIRRQDPEIDEQTLADTVEGLTDLHKILEAILRSALEDEALAIGLKGRITEMEGRLERLKDRASTRVPSTATPEQADRPLGFHPDDTTPIPRPARYYGRRTRAPVHEPLRQERRKTERDSAPPLAPATPPTSTRIDKSQLPLGEPK